MEAPDSVLITGANGFIGSRLCRHFLADGFRVIAGVRKSADLSLLKDLAIDYRYGDITAPESLPAMVAGVDYVIHNAGLVKAKREDQFFAVNEQGTHNLLSALAEHNPGVRKVVVISSLAAAGPSRDGLAVTESDPPNPITVYGRSKLAGEQVALGFAGRLPIVVVRPPGVYGPGDKEIFTFFQTVYRHLKPCVGNTRRKLQLVHVDDLCRGVALAAARPTQSGSIYFIAENRSYAMEELVGMLQQACGRKGIPVILPDPVFRFIGAVSESLFRLVGATPMLTREKANEILQSWEITTEKAKRELGFESQIPFALGAKETYDWYVTQRWL
jgi:nucleoside-diphosphate-sugar epimerase